MEPRATLSLEVLGVLLAGGEGELFGDQNHLLGWLFSGGHAVLASGHGDPTLDTDRRVGGGVFVGFIEGWHL